MIRHLPSKLALAAVVAGAFSAVPVTQAFAAGPPAAATAFSTAVIGPQGGTVSGFGMTATFKPGAVAQSDLVILGNWPNGLDVAPPSGQAAKTFGLQVCNDSTGTPTGCTSEFGDYANSPSGSERIHGTSVPYTGYQGVTFGSASNKLVTFTIDTGGNNVYIYNPNFNTTATAYPPKALPSSSSNGVLTFQTFRPIVWTVTSPTS
jgi:hypothetical protein